MVLQRTHSPTSLLWAHQLKREHAYLLARITTLEQSAKTQRDNAGAAATIADVERLAEQVECLKRDAAGADALAKLESAVRARVDGVQGGAGALVLKVAALEGGLGERFGEERRRGFEREKGVLRRIADVEREGEGLGGRVRGLEERVGEMDVEGLGRDVARVGEEGRGREAEVSGLEARVGGLERMVKELKEVRFRAAPYVEAVSSSTAVPRGKAAASHPATRSTAAAKPTAARGGKRALARPAASQAVRASAKNGKKGADASNPNRKGTPARVSKSTAARPKSKTARGKEVVRAGPGLVEVERSPSAAQGEELDVDLAPRKAAHTRPGKPTSLTRRALRAHTKATGLDAPESSTNRKAGGASIIRTQRMTRSQAAKLIGPVAPAKRIGPAAPAKRIGPAAPAKRIGPAAPAKRTGPAAPAKRKAQPKRKAPQTSRATPKPKPKPEPKSAESHTYSSPLSSDETLGNRKRARDLVSQMQGVDESQELSKSLKRHMSQAQTESDQASKQPARKKKATLDADEVSAFFGV